MPLRVGRGSADAVAMMPHAGAPAGGNVMQAPPSMDRLREAEAARIEREHQRTFVRPGGPPPPKPIIPTMAYNNDVKTAMQREEDRRMAAEAQVMERREQERLRLLQLEQERRDREEAERQRKEAERQRKEEEKQAKAARKEEERVAALARKEEKKQSKEYQKRLKEFDAAQKAEVKRRAALAKEEEGLEAAIKQEYQNCVKWDQAHAQAARDEEARRRKFDEDYERRALDETSRRENWERHVEAKREEFVQRHGQTDGIAQKLEEWAASLGVRVGDRVTRAGSAGSLDAFPQQ